MDQSSSSLTRQYQKRKRAARELPIEASLGDPSKLVLELLEVGTETRHSLQTRVEKAIGEGALRPGDRLPTERAIAIRSGLSRSAVRHALKELEQRGHINREVGRGTYVNDTQARPPDHATMPPADLLEMRLTIEPYLANLIVLRASASDLKLMQETINEGNKGKDWRAAERCDARFHALFYATTHNLGMMRLSEMIIQARHQTAWLNLKQSSFSLDRWKAYQVQHQKILDRITARDAVGVKQAVHEHLLTVQNRML